MHLFFASAYMVQCQGADSLNTHQRVEGGTHPGQNASVSRGRNTRQKNYFHTPVLTYREFPFDLICIPRHCGKKTPHRNRQHTQTPWRKVLAGWPADTSFTVGNCGFGKQNYTVWIVSTSTPDTVWMCACVCVQPAVPYNSLFFFPVHKMFSPYNEALNSVWSKSTMTIRRFLFTNLIFCFPFAHIKTCT